MSGKHISFIIQSCKVDSLIIIAELKQVMKELFLIPENAECRVWHRYMINPYELLNNSSQTLQNAGLYNGQVANMILETCLNCFRLMQAD